VTEDRTGRDRADDRAGDDSGDTDDSGESGRVEQFEELRPLLFSIAYRILGSVSGAEDAVQETWVRFQASGARPDSVKAYLSTIVTRLCLDELRSARVRREEYVGPWFPEPLLSDPYEDPERAAELADSLSMAALLLLERLSPLERAVFVLREVFGFGFAEVATAADRFFDALRDGDVDGLRELLTADVQLVSDSGGKAPNWGRGMFGDTNVAHALVAIYDAFRNIGGVVEQRPVNGEPGAIFRDRDGRVLNTWSLDVQEGRVQAIRTVLNPDKLGHVGDVADAWSVVREAMQARRDDHL
jgi:RNA polymerase sigma-70 factor (ECF subfamily)